MEYYLNKEFDSVPIMWRPTENSGTNLRNFMNKIGNKYNRKFSNYWDLYKWSTENITEFWTEIWNLSEIIHSKKYKEVVDLDTPMQKFPKWFEGAELNFAENLLKYRDDNVALILAGEDRTIEKVTYAQLFGDVTLYSAAFRKMGLQKGDVVACYMSNRKEAIIAMIAVTSIGAIWTGALPQLGSQAVLSRITQLKPKILITVDRFLYNKEEYDLLQNIEKITDGLPSLLKVIIVSSKENSTRKDISKIRNSCFLDTFLLTGKDPNGFVPPIIFEQVSISHPVFISFTSGTTGLPKAILHGSGMLLSVVKDYGIICDSDRQSVWMLNSPAGWSIWNVFSSMLFLGSVILLFEGFPFFLSPTYIWDLIDQFKITYTFLPASVLDELEKKRYLPTESHNLKSVKLFLGFGSVVKPTLYDFMYKILNGNIPFSSGYGSTECMGSPFNTELTLPIYRGETNSITLGYDVECLNEEGKHVLGEIGALVISKPVPNLPLGLWGDEDGSKCRETYFSKYPGKFLVGDNALINPVTKGIVFCGRSDHCLKQKGFRFGSSEIYNIVEKFPVVIDSLCVSQYNKVMDERAVLFLKMRTSYQFNQELVLKISAAITNELTPGHVPDVIIQIEDIPYNMNGKKMEILVKNVINRRPYNADSVSNPDSLKYYINNIDLQDF